MKAFQSALVAVVLLLLPAVAMTAPASAQVLESFAVSDIAGTYDVTGRNPDGSAYQGELVVSAAGEGATLQWTVGAQSFQGKGLIVGNVLLVDWNAEHPIIYTVGTDGELAATWDDGRASERAVPR